MANLGRQIEINWPFPLSETTQDKHVPSSAVSNKYSSDLTGVEGLTQGGVRPISGFSKEYDFDGFQSHAEHSWESTIVDFFPVHFRVEYVTYGYGFVYRALRPDLSSEEQPADIFLDFYLADCQQWVKGIVIKEGVSSTEVMDVVSTGRLVFVGMRGESSTLFYVEKKSTQEGTLTTSSSSDEDCVGDYEVVIEDTPGPGKKPSLNDKWVDTSSQINYFPTTQPLDGSSAEATPIVTKELPPAEAFEGGGGSNLPLGVFTPSSLLSRTNSSVVSQIQAIDPSFDCSYLEEESTLLVEVQNEDSITWETTHYDPSIEVSSSTSDLPEYNSLQEAVEFVGFTPGGRRTPDGLVISDPYRIYDTATIPTSHYVDQTTTLFLYVYLDRELVDDDKIVFDLQMHEHEDPSDPGRFGGNSGWDTIVEGANFRLDGGSYDSHLKENVSAAGGTYVTYDPANPFTVVVERMDDRPLYGSVYYYRVAVNISSLYSTDTWSPGTFGFKWKIRTLCGTYAERNQYVSRFWEYKIDPILYNLQNIVENGDDAIGESGIGPNQVLAGAQRLLGRTYTLAYILFDSKTGRKSPLSEIKRITIPGSNVESGEEEIAEYYLSLDIVYDSSKYDKVYLYRSLGAVDQTTVTLSAILGLDGLYNLKDHQVIEITNENLDSDDYKHSWMTYLLRDEELMYSPTFNTQTPLYDEQIPYGGEYHYFGNTLFVSNINDTPQSVSGLSQENDTKRGLGELRWSSMTDYSPELFPVSNYFIPDTSTNEIIGFASVSGSLIGFSRDRMYFIRKESGGGTAYMRLVEMHEGYGTINANSIASVGAFVYFLTRRGIKTVTPQGRLDDVRAFDYLISNDWSSSLNSCTLSFDSASSALFLLNPDEKKAAVLWFNSARTTMVSDLTFDQTKQGVWTQEKGNYDGPLIERSFFLQNPPLAAGIEAASAEYPRLFTLDYKREKTDGGRPRVTTLDGSGDTIVTTTVGLATVSGATVSRTITETVDRSWYGSYVYVLASSDSSYLGKKSLLGRVEANGRVLGFMDSEFSGLPVNSILGISPVYFHWGGHSIQLVSDKTGQAIQDQHRSKQVDSLSGSFTGVSTTPSNASYARFRALVYEGDSAVAKDSSFVLDNDKSLATSVKDGQSDLWAAFGSSSLTEGNYGVQGAILSPGLETYVPDLDFRLMSVLVNGKILPSYRTDLPSV